MLSRPFIAVGLSGCALLGLAPVSRAQNYPPLTFSIDWHGPTLAATDAGTGIVLSDGDILRPILITPVYGQTENPAIVFNAGQLGLQRYAVCEGHLPGTPCGIEVDALSYGLDFCISGPTAPFRIFFSTDEEAVGLQPLGNGPNVQTEGGPIGDLSADILVDRGITFLPIIPGHVAIIDGDGERSASGWVYPGIGLVEPNPAGSGMLPNPGDNLDAFNFGPIPSAAGDVIYFSLDFGLVDPLLGTPNSNSAQQNGFRAGDVIQRVIGIPTPQVYAPAQLLGLDLFGANTDDLDALILRENGIPGFQPSMTPYDWCTGPGPEGGLVTDMLLFSVRRGSMLVTSGTLDAILGIPIEEGDLLTTPIDGGGPPGILIRAEDLGLSTIRCGAGLADDMNGADAEPRDDEFFDCNGNGIEDSVDIANGAVDDDNMNGIPDCCEDPGAKYCTCPGANAVCNNADAGAGCANSTGVGASLDGTGSSSVVADDLLLTATDLPPNQFGLLYMGAGQMLTSFGDGLRCVAGGASGVFRFGVQSSGASGTIALGPGIVSESCTMLPPAACLVVGSTWNFQAWYRDPTGPCGNFYNLSNGWTLTFTM